MDHGDPVMLRCERCEKNVNVYSIPPGAGGNDAIGPLMDAASKEGALVLFNPPPFAPYHCPECGDVLVDG